MYVNLKQYYANILLFFAIKQNSTQYKYKNTKREQTCHNSKLIVTGTELLTKFTV
uniref:Uncharacterized protein n=1 Tax=Octopus bimaculoides TaxID=37653 RepID=A0A0L8H4A8_OCTBM